MLPEYLLDTNILSDLIRNPQGIVADQIRQKGEGCICTSIIVAAELRFGAEKSGSDKLLERVELILSALEVLPLEMPADHYYGKLRWALQQQGTPIGPNDLLIASQALVSELVLVTANLREFKRVPGLKVENWLAH